MITGQVCGKYYKYDNSSKCEKKMDRQDSHQKFEKLFHYIFLTQLPNIMKQFGLFWYFDR